MRALLDIEQSAHCIATLKASSEKPLALVEEAAVAKSLEKQVDLLRHAVSAFEIEA